MTDTAVFEFEQYIRTAATLHAEQFRPSLPDILKDAPIPQGKPEQAHGVLEGLAYAFKEIGRASRQDPPHSPAGLYGAALYGYGEALEVFLYELSPEDPYSAAVLFVTYAAHNRDQTASTTPEAAAFLAGADEGTLTPEEAHRALNAFPDLYTLAAFLASHHAFSVACEALALPDETDPAELLGEALEVMRREVYSVPVTRAEA